MESDDPYELGQEAARCGKEATDCPFEMGKKRRAWLDGYFSIKPPLAGAEPDAEDDE